MKIANENSTISWLDSKTIRFDMPIANGGHMIARDGKVYMVNTGTAGGMPPVMEISGMMQAFTKIGSAKGGNASPLDVRIDSIKASGKTETVAGIKGDLYELTTTDKNGTRKTLEAVFTDDPRVIEMTAAYLTFSEAMVGAEKIAEFKNSLPKNKRGLLRVGDDMVMQSISGDAPAASAFDLPAKPVNMGDMMKALMQQAQ